jgi:hypothetical protein
MASRTLGLNLSYPEVSLSLLQVVANWSTTCQFKAGSLSLGQCLPVMALPLMSLSDSTVAKGMYLKYLICTFQGTLGHKKMPL